MTTRKPSNSVEKIEYGGEPPLGPLGVVNQNAVSQPAAQLPLASTLGNPTPAYVLPFLVIGAILTILNYAVECLHSPERCS